MTKFLINRVMYRGKMLQAFFADPDTRMIMGAVQGSQLSWGKEPSKAFTVAFLDIESALAYGKGLCRKEAGRDDVDFILEDEEYIPKEERDSQSLLVPRHRM